MAEAIEAASLALALTNAELARRKAGEVKTDLTSLERAGRTAEASVRRAEEQTRRLEAAANQAVSQLGKVAGVAGFLGRAAKNLGLGEGGDAVGSVLGETAAGAAQGAVAGSVVPGIGTALGAGIGAGLGLASGVAKETDRLAALFATDDKAQEALSRKLLDALRKERAAEQPTDIADARAALAEFGASRGSIALRPRR